MSNNDDIKKVLEAINSFTPANSALTVDSETPNVEQDGVRITKEGIEEAWDTMEAPKAKEATADADKAVTEHDSGEDVTLTVNTPTEIKVPAEQADMIANMLKLAGVEVGDAPSMDAPDMDSPMDMDADGENMPMVIPTDDEAGDDEEAPLMGACASEGNEFTGKRQDAIDAGEDEFEVDGKTHKVKGNEKNEAEEVSEAKDKMVCKHCGDEIHKPVSKSCECDCNDENGDHWVKENKEMAEVEESIEKAWNENVLDDTNKENAQTARILQARIREAMLKSQRAEEVSTEEFKEIARLARILQARIGGVTSGPDYDSNGDAVTEGVSKSKMIDDAESMSMGEFVEEYSAQGMSDEEAKQAYKEIIGEAITEAVGSFADPILDLCDEIGCDPDHPVFADLVRYLDGDTIADFVKEFRSNHEYDNGMEYESVEVDEKVSDTAWSTGDAIMYKGKEIDTAKLDYDMQDISDGIYELNAPVMYTDGTEVADEDMNDLYDLPELNDWIFQHYTSESVEESDTAWSTGDAIMYKGKEIDLRRLDYDMQDISDGIYQINAPAYYTDGTEIADGDYDGLYDLPELNDYIHQDYTSESVEEGAMSGIHQDAQEMDKEEFEAKYPQFPDMWDEVHSQMNEESKRILGLSGVPVAEAQSPAQKAAFEKMLANKKGNKKDDKDEVAEAVTTTDLITKYQGSEVDINDMNRLLKLSGMGELDESKLANAPAGTSMDEPKEHDKLPSEVGKGSGNSDYINRADGQGENPMGMHTADDVEESFTTALGEYRKFVAEGIMGKKTKKAKK